MKVTKPTYEELFETVRMLAAANFRLQEENKPLQKKIEELEERLGLHSQNSSKPPSHDQKKNKQAPKGGAKPGRQGHYRKLFSEDQISRKVISPLKNCPHCGSQRLNYKDPEIFQQIDLPPIRPEITQIERTRACCLNCQRHVVAPFPEGYHQTAFGPRLTTFVGMCSSVYRLSKRSTQSLLKTAFGIECALGSIPEMERRVSKGLETAYGDLFRQVNQAKVGYIDETSFRQQAKTHYVWTVTTQNAAFLRILPSRGIDSLNQIRPRGHPGMTVSDRYQVYAYDT